MFEVMDACADIIKIKPKLSDRYLLYSMDNTWNGATPTIPTNFTSLYVEMRTCFKTTAKTHAGIGFRAIVKTNGTQLFQLFDRTFLLYYTN